MSPITEHYIYRCGPNCLFPNTDDPTANAGEVFFVVDIGSVDSSKKYNILRICSLPKSKTRGIYGENNSFTNPQIVALKKAHNCLQSRMQNLKISGKE